MAKAISSTGILSTSSIPETPCSNSQRQSLGAIRAGYFRSFQRAWPAGQAHQAHGRAHGRAHDPQAVRKLERRARHRGLGPESLRPGLVRRGVFPVEIPLRPLRLHLFLQANRRRRGASDLRGIGWAARGRRQGARDNRGHHNITFPTDVKLLSKVIKKCRKIADSEGIKLRRSFRRELPGLIRQRFKSRKSIKRIRTMASALIRELERKMLIRFHWANLAALIPMPCAEYQRFSGVEQ